MLFTHFFSPPSSFLFFQLSSFISCYIFVFCRFPSFLPMLFTFFNSLSFIHSTSWDNFISSIHPSFLPSFLSPSLPVLLIFSFTFFTRIRLFFSDLLLAASFHPSFDCFFPQSLLQVYFSFLFPFSFILFFLFPLFFGFRSAFFDTFSSPFSTFFFVYSLFLFPFFFRFRSAFFDSFSSAFSINSFFKFCNFVSLFFF